MLVRPNAGSDVPMQCDAPMYICIVQLRWKPAYPHSKVTGVMWSPCPQICSRSLKKEGNGGSMMFTAFTVVVLSRWPACENPMAVQQYIRLF